MGTKIHNLTFYPVLENCKFWGVTIVPWTLFFDGSTCDRGAGIGIVLISPRGKKYEFSLPIVATSTNNQADYQALIKGLDLSKEVHADAVKIFGDSMLVINQLAGSYE